MSEDRSIPGGSASATAPSAKVKGEHRQRAAWIYVRQSSPYQVQHNLESQRRQYDRVEQAVAYGWDRERIVVVDDDQAKTAALPNSRPGFARLITAVARGEVGIVISLEGARLARNGPDWSQLLFLCRWTDTLIGDEQGVYDAQNPSDRMLLGIRGEVNQLELDTSIQRMVAARWSKARRGDVFTILPAGYEIDDHRELVLTPDEAVVLAIRTVFAKFEELGAGRQVWAYLVEHGMKLPIRNCRLRSHPVEWRTPRQRNVLAILHNPIYAGAYAFGRQQTTKCLDPEDPARLRVRTAPRKDWRTWPVLIHDHHAAYISWERWLAIQEQLRNNLVMSSGDEQGTGAVREGGALLQGLMRCGHCARSMYVNMGGQRRGTRGRTPQYRCTGARSAGIGADCQTVGARRVDAFAVESFLDATGPASLQVALRVQEQAEQASQNARRLWQAQVEKAEYEAQRAQRRYEAVEPENRQVARSLERAWNDRLRELEAVRTQARRDLQTKTSLGQDELKRLKHLCTDLRSVWSASTTTDRDRKQLLRCLIEEVQLHTEPDQHTVTVVWKGGASSTRTLVRERGNRTCRTSDDAVELARKLAAELDDRQIAVVLNKQGHRGGSGNPFTKASVASLRASNAIPPCPPPPPSDPVAGPFTADQAAQELGVTSATVHRWLRDGLVAGTQLAAGAPWRIHLTPSVRQRLTTGAAPAGWLSLTEAAKRLEISKQLVAHRVNAGQLEALRTQVGKRTLWRIRVPRPPDDRQENLFDRMISEDQGGA